ncbi:MAG TPA: hypothetical protein VMW87_13285 [Spirochaetia bacterium]|nr:hypothetical protein [Spirochaetia bacterium]
MGYKRRHGVVAVIDALGMTNATLEVYDHFLQARNELVKKSFQRWPIASGSAAETRNESKTNIYFHSFVGTLIIAVELLEFSSESGKVSFPTDSEESDALFYGMWMERLSSILGDLLRDALMKGIVFRGALTAGEYIIDKKSNSILGPAINDAVAWYKAFDSTGIILTPHASTIVDYLRLHRDIWRSIVKTSLMLKGDRRIEQYVVNWPNAFLKGDDSEEDISESNEQFRLVLTQLEIPKGTEQKYYSAINFFNEVIDRKLI